MKTRTQKNAAIATLALLAILLHLALRFAFHSPSIDSDLPLWAALTLGGIPLLRDLLAQLLRRNFGSDLLAGISIVASVVLREYLAGTVIVLMLSGGEALEAYATSGATSVLRALAKRMPKTAHRREGETVVEIEADRIVVGDLLIVYPHEICPVDGIVVEGRGAMDESYLTGEPYRISKTPGSGVISGALNGDDALTVRADRLTKDSRYEKILRVMEEAERHRPEMRRSAASIGRRATPLAVAVALGAWAASGDPRRFLSTLVIATPCPLLLAIPIVIVGSISLAAKRRILVKSAAALERIGTCRTAIFDKTGTLTYGEPVLTERSCGAGFNPSEILSLAASLERYSKHPLSGPILKAARKEGVPILEVSRISEPPGEGIQGIVAGREVLITGRDRRPDLAGEAPPTQSGLECVVAVDGRYAALFAFRDEPRSDSPSFVRHLSTRHGLKKLILLSGDRESEVRYLAERVGIQEIHFNASPEEKLLLVKEETRRARTLFVGDGINDAPAMVAATVGVALGQNNDVTGEAADVTILDNSLAKVDEILHIGRRMRRIALQSALGGMALSVIGMAFAFRGSLTPVNGAIAQEVIDVIAVLNALRASFPPAALSDVAPSADGKPGEAAPPFLVGQLA
jgi:heavy metal translocating P-type ATPase